MNKEIRVKSPQPLSEFHLCGERREANTEWCLLKLNAASALLCQL